MSSRNMVRLGDVADYQTGFPFKSKDYAENGIRLLRGDNIGQGLLRWDGVKYWPEENCDEVEKFYLQKGDVIIAMDRPWIEAGLKYASVSAADLPCLLVQRVARLRGTEYVTSGFLRYLIGSPDFTDHILNVTTGTAVPHISGRDILAFEFDLPPLSEQCEIAAILGALDDKIEMNRKTAATLEAIARALYRSWFVDFDPVWAKLEGRAPAHMDPTTAALFPDRFTEDGLPEGWELTSIGEVAEIVGGSTPSTKEPEFWEDGAHLWATPKDLSNLRQPVLFDTERRVTDRGLSQIGSGLSPSGTVLLSSRAPIGYLAIAQVPVAVNQGFIALRETHQISSVEAFCWCHENMEAIHANANGSTFQEISKKNFRPLPYVLAPVEVRQAFRQRADALFQRLSATAAQSQTLATLRDSLLPRLMSGELRVPEARDAIEGGA